MQKAGMDVGPESELLKERKRPLQEDAEECSGSDESDEGEEVRCDVSSLPLQCGSHCPPLGLVPFWDIPL